MSIPELTLSVSNKSIYQRLKRALSLNLRRQIFIVACDDLDLRDSFAVCLQTELSSSNPPAPALINSRFISLQLKSHNPNPWQTIGQWLTQHPITDPASRICGFQILGIEHLTRQPAGVQWSFLSALRSIEHYLPAWEFSVLLWVPRPWLCAIQQSAPEFWRWRTGVFEFEGEPTPISREHESETEKTPQETQLNPPPAQEPQPNLETPTTPAPVPQTPNKSVELADLILADAAGAGDTKDPQPALSDLSWMALQTLQYIELMHEQQCSPQSLALAYQCLGNFYRDHILAGHASPAQLKIAIHAYEQALEWLENPATQPPAETQECLALVSEFRQSFNLPLTRLDASALSELLNDLGTLYWRLSRLVLSGESVTAMLPDLERCIARYQQAALKMNPETHPQAYARLHKNLGAAWGELARYQHRAENLQHTVRAYQEALLYLDLQGDPQQYAATQNNLGTAYWNLAQLETPAEHLKSAIAAYLQALSCYQPQREPLNWAGVLNNLGTAYWNLAQHEPSEALILKAIAAYQEALQYRTPEQVPVAAAATQNNLGAAYWHLATQCRNKQARVDALQQAIDAYQVAIALAQKLPASQLPFDLLAARSNLGLAHYQLATDPYFPPDEALKATHLDIALHSQITVWSAWQQRGKAENSQSATPASRERDAEAQQVALSCIVKTIRAFYSECGLQAQNSALSKVPGDLLPEILRAL